VASTVAQRLPEPERRLEVDGYPYPIDPRLLADVRQFRLAFGAAQGRVAREPGAVGSRNATKRVRLVLDFPDGVVPTSADLESWLSGRSTITRGYWALLANADIYRVAEAVVAGFQTDLWTTKGDRLAQGDRVIIWEALGSGRRRGIVALGEVLEPARSPPMLRTRSGSIARVLMPKRSGSESAISCLPGSRSGSASLAPTSSRS
jgi:hypothetical protein